MVERRPRRGRDDHRGLVRRARAAHPRRADTGRTGRPPAPTPSTGTARTPAAPRPRRPRRPRHRRAPPTGADPRRRPPPLRPPRRAGASRPATPPTRRPARRPDRVPDQPARDAPTPTPTAPQTPRPAPAPPRNATPQRPAPARPQPPAAPRPASPRRAEPAAPPSDLARVARALDEGRKLAERHDRPDLGSHLEQARKRLGEQVLSVAVVGEFKRGKSTLVNALLQTDVCPTDADIVTAVPTVVRYGAEPSAAAQLEPVDRPPAELPGRPAPSRSPSTWTGSPTSSPRPRTRAGGAACAPSRSGSPTAC